MQEFDKDYNRPSYCKKCKNEGLSVYRRVVRKKINAIIYEWVCNKCKCIHRQDVSQFYTNEKG